MTYAEIITALAIVLAAAGLFLALVGAGFYMGRKTVIPYSERRDKVFDPGEPGKIEYDPYAEAMMDSRDIKDLK
ncbi:MAG TPA: hypothetical protein PL061_13675 [Syntrophales bacterium]|nr:hypothetical protein [Syntrophales bacterium]